MKKRAIAIGLTVVALSGCGLVEQHKSDKGNGDGPKPKNVDQRPADFAVEFPDGFANIATKCVYEGYRGFSSTGDGKSIAIVADPQCHVEDSRGTPWEDDRTDVLG